MLVLHIKVVDMFPTTTHFRSLGQSISLQQNLFAQRWHVIVKIQLSQMSMAKLTIKFRLQAYSGATIIDYKNRVFSILGLIDDQKEGSLYHKYRSNEISIYKNS